MENIGCAVAYSFATPDCDALIGIAHIVCIKLLSNQYHDYPYSKPLTRGNNRAIFPHETFKNIFKSSKMFAVIR